MGLVLLTAFIGIPLLEIMVFIEAGDWLGLWPTIAAVVFTALLGATLVRIQGFGVLMRVRQQLDAGRTPVAEVFDGLCLLAAGALLLTPGFITDTMGFLLLVPPLRAWIRGWLVRYLIASGRVHMPNPAATPHGDPFSRDQDGVTIDGDFEEVRDGPSRWGQGASKDDDSHNRKLPPSSPR